MNAKTKKRVAEIEALIATKKVSYDTLGRHILELNSELEKLVEIPKRLKYIGRCYMTMTSGGRFYDFENNCEIKWPHYVRIDSVDPEHGSVYTTTVDIYPDGTAGIDSDNRFNSPEYYETGQTAGRLTYKRVTPAAFKKALKKAIARIP